MNAVLFESPSTQNMKLLLALADKLGIKSKKMNEAELESFFLAEEIEKGMKTTTVSKAEVIEALQAK
jgi:NACalpha-BTF3-like transcription factor